MKNLKALLISSICILSAFSSSAENVKNQDWNFPYGNFGLDYSFNKIEEAKQKIYNETGLTFSYDYYATIFSNPSGGENQGTNYSHIMIFQANADFEKMLGIKGGSLTISGAYNSGKDLSGKIGNFYTISEACVNSGWYFYELYYSQNLSLPWDDSIVIKAGRMSMSDNFASLPVFGYLASGSMDSVPEAMFFASPFTASTTAAWGMVLEYETSNNLTFSYGLFQVPPNLNSTSWDGTNFGINSNDGYMMTFQMQWSPTFANGLQGEYLIGGYYFDGYDIAYLNSSGSKDSGYGFYIQGQQQVWVNKANDSNFILVWCGTQYAPIEKISPVVWQVYAGMQFAGFIPNRSQDSIFISWTSGIFSDYYNSGNSNCETVFEVNYLWQVNDNLSIQPVLQYVLNPNGVSSIDNALVVGAQVLLSF